MPYALLSQRGLIRFTGEDTLTFLQGLVSNDVMPLKGGKPVYAALLSPQGKFLHDFFLAPDGDSILLDGYKPRLPDLLKRLAMYKLRAKVKIEALPETMGVAALWDADIKNQSGLIRFIDPRLPALGSRMIGEMAVIEKQATQKTDEAAYEHHRIALGIPDGALDMIADKSLLSQFGFEDLHGVDFKKGCYVGQEVTARAKHLGQMRKFLYQVKAKNGDLPGLGQPVCMGENMIGELRSCSGAIGLAILHVEQAEKSVNEDCALRCIDAMLEIALPPWIIHAPKITTE